MRSVVPEVAPPLSLQNNYDMIDYVNQLREGVLEAFTGIVAAMKASGKGAHDPETPAHIRSQSARPSCTDDPQCAAPLLDGPKSVRVDRPRCDRPACVVWPAQSLMHTVGDLADAFPDGSLKSQLTASWVSDSLRIARSRGGGGATAAEIRKLAKWAAQAVRKASTS